MEATGCVKTLKEEPEESRKVGALGIRVRECGMKLERVAGGHLSPDAEGQGPRAAWPEPRAMAGSLLEDSDQIFSKLC